MPQLATTGIFIDKYHPKKDGKCGISIRVTFERKKKYYPTTYNLTADEYAKVMAERPRGEYKEIFQELNSLETKATNIIGDMPFFTWGTFEKQFLKHRGTSNSISAALQEYIDTLTQDDRVGSAVSCKNAKSSLKDYNSTASFAEITPAFLKKYEKWMLDKGNSVTTVGFYLRALRTIINIAISEGIIAKELYPFGKRKYEIPTANNTKKALSLADIALIYNYEAIPGSNMEKAKDFWMFMYYCNGLNVKDVCRLKYKNIQGDVLSFERSKTVRTKRTVELIRVPLLDEVKAVMDRWGNKVISQEAYIFPILSNGLTATKERDLIQLFTRLLNDNMKRITKDVGITADVTTYSARHSFATVLKRSGASTEAISEALGHSNIKTTQSYLGSFEDDSKKEMAKALNAFKKVG